MDQEAYREATARTWNTGPTIKEQKCNAALGLVGEMAEYICEPSPDELGDILYYLATVRRLMGVMPSSIDETFPMAQKIDDLMPDGLIEAGKVAEAVKSHVFHWEPAHLVSRPAEAVALAIGAECHLRGWALAEIRQQNVDKLRERFPDGFDADRTGADR